MNDKVQRYSMVTDIDTQDIDPVPSSGGPWVRFDDHARLLAERDARIAELEALLPPSEAGEGDKPVAWLVRCRRTGRVIWSDLSRSTAEGYARQIAHRMPDNSLDTEVIPFHIAPVMGGIAKYREADRAPIAWRAEFEDGWTEYADENGDGKDEWTGWANPPVRVIPLYTATPPAAEVDAEMVERAIIAGCATRPSEYPPNWPNDYSDDEQSHGRAFMRAALTAALRPFTEENEK